MKILHLTNNKDIFNAKRQTNNIIILYSQFKDIFDHFQLHITKSGERKKKDKKILKKRKISLISFSSIYIYI